MRTARPDKRTILARKAADWINPLLLLADRLIHGGLEMTGIDWIMGK